VSALHVWDEPFEVERTHKSARDHLLNLSSNELLHPDLTNLFQDLLAAFHPNLVTTYPTYIATLEQLAAHCKVDPTHLVLSSGSDDAIRLVIGSLATRSGRLILQVPNYDGWARHAMLQRVKIIPIRFGEDISDRFSIDQFDRTIQASQPTVVAISNPNGPTGYSFNADDLASLSELCARHGHLLVIDECYAAFSNSYCDLSTSHQDHVIRIESFSKSYGLAGARIACIKASPFIADYLSRFRPEYSTSGPSLMLLRAALDREQVFQRIRAEVMASSKKLISTVACIRPHWKAIASSANFINFRTSGPAEALHVTQQLLARQIRIRNTSDEIGLNGCVRTTLCHPTLHKLLIDSLRTIELFSHLDR